MAMRKVWKGLRWGAFLFALSVDILLFYTADPFTTLSFVATGLASLIMFYFFMRLANQFRGSSRIKRILEENETIVYDTCVHWVRLLDHIRADKTAWRWIGIPVLIAVGVTSFEALWGVCLLTAKLGVNTGWLGLPFRLLPHNEVLIGFYIPLVFSIPFAITHVSEWSTHRYVITPLRIIIHHGIFDYHMHGILLARVVDAQQDYTFWQQFLNYGDVVFHETSGGTETLECVWGPKKFAKIAVRYSHALSAAGDKAVEEDGQDN
jgi:hypothetical protein